VIKERGTVLSEKKKIRRQSFAGGRKRMKLGDCTKDNPGNLTKKQGHRIKSFFAMRVDQSTPKLSSNPARKVLEGEKYEDEKE